MIAIRTASAVESRVTAFLARNTKSIPRLQFCDCCCRYVAESRLSRRRWCALCEVEFRRALLTMPGHLRNREAA